MKNLIFVYPLKEIHDCNVNYFFFDMNSNTSINNSGVKVLFKVGVVLLRYGLDLVKSDSMFDTLQALRNLPASITAEEFLIARVNEVNITDADLEKEHYRQLKKMRQEDRSIGAVDPPM